MGQKRPIRLLIAEDSAVCRELLVTIFQNAAGIQVVGTARDGAEAVRLVNRLKPDIVTMDIYMPVMDGYEATRQIMAQMPCPIVMVSHKMTPDANELTFNALQAGALAILPKPTAQDSVQMQAELVEKVKLMADVKVVKRPLPSSLPVVVPGTAPLRLVDSPPLPLNVIALAASTGGPGALAAILSRLPAHFPVPIVIVQHVAVGFGSDLSAWLNKQTPLRVRIGQVADGLCPGEVLLAPDNYHMQVNEFGYISLRKAAVQDRYCPSADDLFQSVAAVYGDTAVGIILTGMGDDGVQGLQALHQAGAMTIAQDEATSIVFGMPGRAVEAGAVTLTQPIDEIARTILNIVLNGEVKNGV